MVYFAFGGNIKNLITAVTFSALLHFIYFSGMFLIGYFQTTSYTPDIDGQWENVTYLQNEVVFGTTGSPLFYLFTLIGVSFAVWVALLLHKRLAGKNN
ncbi:hypothetical protein [Bacillus sp. B-jedd]|uniref:hypothetical protein n=1 Tax=Bacillus sp. B-jedd TaxID=1476857 RepID=UPI0005155B44|nr:hypothetical protein [Bacillus sp. B-jedd]CEG26168.1 hypothetical protein BN1002_01009 [Bacillus sp. B-jedd]